MLKSRYELIRVQITWRELCPIFSDMKNFKEVNLAIQFSWQEIPAENSCARNSCEK